MKRAFNNLYKKFVYVPKHAKLPDKVFRFRMVFSLLAILAYATFMVSFSFALFNSETSTNNSSIASAYYTMTVTKDKAPLANGIYECSLESSVNADMHTFVLTASGTASTGYCEIIVRDKGDVNGVSYCTAQVKPNSSITLTVQAAPNTVIEFIPQWGTSSAYVNGSGYYGDNGVIAHSVTNVVYYTVEPTAKLSNIAAHYGVPEEDIITYNDLSVVSVFSVDEEITMPILIEGMALAIPNPTQNVDLPYQVPYATYTVEPTATIEAISAHYGISVYDINAFNTETAFGVGAELKIPNANPEITKYAVSHATYIVAENATLSGIAEHYKVTEADILLYNGITEITEGIPIEIPGVTAEYPYYTVPVAEPSASEDSSGDNNNTEDTSDPSSNNTDNTTGNEGQLPTTGNETESTVNPDLGGTTGTDDTPVQNPVTDESVSLYVSDNTYELMNIGMITLDKADILIYKKQENADVNAYQKDLDRRITGLEADNGEYFCTIVNKVEMLSLCFEITDNIENGYLRIVIGDSVYYTVQITKDSYIFLDIQAPLNSEIRLEAYSGDSPVIVNGGVLYGDDLNNSNDGNSAWLLHEEIKPVVDPSTEGGDGQPDNNTATEGGNKEEQTGGNTNTEGDKDDETEGNQSEENPDAEGDDDVTEGNQTAGNLDAKGDDNDGTEGEQTGENTNTEGGNESEESKDEPAMLYDGTDPDYKLVSESTILLKDADILIYKGHEQAENETEYQKDLDARITGLEAVEVVENKAGEYFCKLSMSTEKLSLCFKITENIEQGYLKIIIGENEYFTVQLKKDSYVRLDIVAPKDTEIIIEAYIGAPQEGVDDKVLYGDDLNDDTDECNAVIDYLSFVEQQAAESAQGDEEDEPADEADSSSEQTPSNDEETE